MQSCLQACVDTNNHERVENGVDGTTTLSDAILYIEVASTYAESDGHRCAKKLHEEAFWGQAAPHAHAVEVGLHYRYS